MPSADFSAIITISDFEECVRAIFLQLVPLSISFAVIFVLTNVYVSIIKPCLSLSILLIALVSVSWEVLPARDKGVVLFRV